MNHEGTKDTMRIKKTTSHGEEETRILWQQFSLSPCPLLVFSFVFFVS